MRELSAHQFNYSTEIMLQLKPKSPTMRRLIQNEGELGKQSVYMMTCVGALNGTKRITQIKALVFFLLRLVHTDQDDYMCEALKNGHKLFPSIKCWMDTDKNTPVLYTTMGQHVNVWRKEKRRPAQAIRLLNPGTSLDSETHQVSVQILVATKIDCCTALCCLHLCQKKSTAS